MVIDPGMSNVKDILSGKTFERRRSSMDLDTAARDETYSRIYLNTLAPFTSYRSRSYAMSALKMMTGTKNFLNKENKNCQIATFEACQRKRYMEKVRGECNCIPWAVWESMAQKVNAKYRLIVIKLNPGCQLLLSNGL